MTRSIRLARTADAEAIRDIHLASIKGLGGERYTEAQVDAWAHERDPADYPIDEEETTVFVAEQGGSIIGFGWLTLEGDADFEAEADGKIGAIYVHPGFARRGIGTTIYQALETRARERGLDSLGLWASLNAVQFYEVQGYSKVRELTYEFGGEVEGPAVEMRKTLDR
ncbi:GNAT family N-acetyltransferase [Halodesulfurarchaeum sp.]|uniref:GNAT family N-acetyltransferase n=1 Tax=Halodesulfurarchaeum sp. TaxID=1980530 RepID=UPI001BC12DB4|nr:GNAT family N-acetyltransferase [Halodesulfurarchaeum sp.]